MTRRIATKTLLAGLTALAVGTGSAIAADEHMTKAEIEEALIGNTIYLDGRNQNGRYYQWAAHYSADGTMTGRAWWDGGQRISGGTWEATGDNQYCRQWETTKWAEGKRGCFVLIRDDDEIEFELVSGSGDDDTVDLEPGNPYGL